MLTGEYSADDSHYLRRALEVSIHIGLVILLVVACLWIVRPFIPLVVWGLIIAISIYPAYAKLVKALRGRAGLAATVCTVVMLAVLIAPVVLLGGTIFEGAQNLTARLKDGRLSIPPPPPSIETWPIIGAPLKSIWSRAATDLSVALSTFAPRSKRLFQCCFPLPLELG